MDSTDPVYIYGLVDPRTNKVRYVGKTVRPVFRLRHHLWEAHALARGTLTMTGSINLRKVKWMARVIEAGEVPQLRVLEECTEDTWEQVEQRVIRDLRASGNPLLNVAPGGQGVSGPKSPEHRAKIGAAHRGRTQPEDAKARIGASSRARHDAGCVNGHPWTEANTRYMNVKRRDGTRGITRSCRICAWEKRPKDAHGRNPSASRFLVETDKALLSRQEAPPRIAETCLRGHPWTPENTIKVRQKSGSFTRTCRECKKLRSNAWYRAGHAEPPERLTCPQGHPRIPENVVIHSDPSRSSGTVTRCRLCLRDRNRLSKRRDRDTKGTCRNHLHPRSPENGVYTITSNGRRSYHCLLCMTGKEGRYYRKKLEGQLPLPF